MPGAWDILRARQQRLLIATIAPPDLRVSLTWTGATRNLVLPVGSDFYTVIGLPFGPARNQAAKACVDGGYGGLLFIDADTIVPPDIATRLQATARDYVGALYYRRYPPFKPAATMLGQNEKQEMVSLDLPAFKPGDIIPVDFLPTGATLITRRCLEALFASFPRPFEWGVDVAPIPAGGDATVLPFSEDFNASWRAKLLGFQPWLHTGIVCKHEFTAVATAQGAEMP